jgi:hypothetical protein
LRRVQAASGIYGMVAAPDKTSLLHPVVGRFTTSQTLRVVQPAEVIQTAPWNLADNKSCELRVTYDVPRCNSHGTLTVRVCWGTIVYRDEIDFARLHCLY